jgi:photosystem II stability/assembly factor-like uncharacterized protein
MTRVPFVRPARQTFVRAILALSAGVAVWLAPVATAQQPSPDLFRSIVFRELGPTVQGGRFVDFAVVEATPRIFYVANATGGLYKTENNGVTFTLLFEHQPVASIGAVALAQSNPDVVYVGTGEANNSRSTYWGDGVYKSTDQGATWTNVGLKDSHHIGRIVVHPTDPNIVYVAALGHLYSENAERGLYKTTDGGATWTKSLAVKSEGKDIGVVDVAMDPKNPNVLYAATYDKVRKPWTFAEGGPGSAVYKTTDAGRTWTKLAGGLPGGMLGRIGVAVSRQDPSTVYAVIENANTPGVAEAELKQRLAEGWGTLNGSPAQMYRSDDAGRTWRQVAHPPNCPMPSQGAPQPAAGAAGAGAGAGAGGGRGGGGGGAPEVRGGQGCAPGGGFNGGYPPYYYGQVRVDPNNKETVYVLSVGWSRSTDGGRTWQGIGFGGDNHALWIDPKDSSHLLLGYDHGLGVSFDGGQTWLRPDNLPTAQYYAVGYDMEIPYNVYGGLQDNGSQKGPSTRPGGGNIPFEDWTTVGGGDGMYNVVDWRDSRWLYNESQFGVIQRVDQLTGQSQSLQGGRPQPPAPYRWNWNAPILVSPHDSNVIYHCAQYVLRSPFRGDSWERISDDLTVNAENTRGGGGNITFATITSFDESPIVPGLLWAGTDDGNVQVTRDGGRTWKNVRSAMPNHPGYWVSRVEASHAAAGTAYVTVTGLRNDDFKPFIWKTTDFGETWTSIAGNLPQEAINVVRESPRNGNVLFVGTDLGVYVTLDGGRAWTKLKGQLPAAPGGAVAAGGLVAVPQGGRGGGRGGGGGGRPRGMMPTVPVHDMKIHPRDRELIIATHGRGILIADISEIEEMTPAVLGADAHLFEIDPVISWVVGQRTRVAGANFAGMSRPTDMGISYYLKSAVTGDVKVRVFDGSRMIAELDGPKAAGVHVVRWNLQARRNRIEGEAAPAGGRGGRGGRGGGAPPAGATAAPGPAQVVSQADIGEYRVVLAVGGREYTQPARIVADPRRR